MGSAKKRMVCSASSDYTLPVKPAITESELFRD